MELIKVGEKTYYIKNPTNIGIYKINDKDVFLIDSGNDKDAGIKILKIINENDWNVVGIINTHSNADHIGGNKVIQDRTSCDIYSSNIETSFIKNPVLESSFLYGGYPLKDLKNKFLLANESKCNIINNLPTGLEYFSLKGHFFDMIGIKTSDNVYFIGDALFSEEIINKYHVFFLYDVKEYLNTLDYLKELNGIIIPSHGLESNNINDLIEINKNKINEICNYLIDICSEEITFENILEKVFNHYSLNMNINQYVLISSTVKSYLSYLVNESKLSYKFIDNKMYWIKE